MSFKALSEGSVHPNGVSRIFSTIPAALAIVFVASHFFVDQRTISRVSCVLIICHAAIRFVAFIVMPVSEIVARLAFIHQSPATQFVIIAILSLVGAWLGCLRAEHVSPTLHLATALL
eukprot:4510427-Prymnesium_polylepis.1